MSDPEFKPVSSYPCRSCKKTFNVNDTWHRETDTRFSFSCPHCEAEHEARMDVVAKKFYARLKGEWPE